MSSGPASNDAQRLKQAWGQKHTPVVLRRTGRGEALRLRMPFAQDNENWLRNGRRHRPKWSPEHTCWEVPKAWFNAFVNRSLDRWGQVYIIQPYRAQEICAPACMNARGHECQCSCMGANHGQGDDGGWFSTHEAFAARWGEATLACRLLRKRRSPAQA